MTHDILFKVDECNSYRDVYIADNLRLKETFLRFSGDKLDNDYFAYIILSPCKNYDNIVYRNEILNEFMASESVLDGMYDILRKIEVQKHKNAEFRRAVVYDNPFVIMQNNAVELHNLLSLMKTLADSAEKIKTDCAPLKAILDRIVYLGKSAESNKMADICKCIESAKYSDDCIMETTLNSSCKIEKCDVINWVSNDGKYRWLKKIMLEDYKEEKYWTRLVSTEVCKNTYNISIQCIADVLRNIEYSIFDEFSLSEKQMTFYRAACKFIKHMQDKGIELCYPKLCGGNRFVAEGLRDTFLCTVSNNVTPHDISLDDNVCNMVIVGDNNSGKTVLLRSIAVARLMFQAGLPITARNAELSLSNGIYTLFESTEKGSASNGDMGLFETEVKKLSDIAKAVSPGAVVFFNEVFQSTDYTEGECALYGVLKAFERANISWVVVTHLPSLVAMFRDDKRVAKIRMGEGYLFSPIGQ